MAAKNRRIVLAARPHGEPTLQNFRLEEAVVPTPRDGEILLRTRWLSLDPYMRVRSRISPSRGVGTTASSRWKFCRVGSPCGRAA
ncbi:MAG: hypothetical protein EOO66_29830, partial [Methylobacterium sp.]